MIDYIDWLLDEDAEESVQVNLSSFVAKGRVPLQSSPQNLCFLPEKQSVAAACSSAPRQEEGRMLALTKGAESSRTLASMGQDDWHAPSRAGKPVFREQFRETRLDTLLAGIPEPRESEPMFETAGLKNSGGSWNLYQGTVQARRTAVYIDRKSSDVTVSLLRQPNAGAFPDLAAVDKAVQRDARRYDNGYTLF